LADVKMYLIMVTYQVGTACFCFCFIFFLSDLVNHAIMIFFSKSLVLLNACYGKPRYNHYRFQNVHLSCIKNYTCPASRTTLVLHPELHLSCTQELHLSCIQNYTCPASRTTLVLHPELH